MGSLLPSLSKGKPVNIPAPAGVQRQRARVCRRRTGVPQELSFLVNGSPCPGIGLSGEGARRPAKHGAFSRVGRHPDGSILPTSLIYIVLLTRGFPPWRHDAVMSTHSGVVRAGIFKDRTGGALHGKRPRALPVAEPLLRIIRFRGMANR